MKYLAILLAVGTLFILADSEEGMGPEYCYTDDCLYSQASLNFHKLGRGQKNYYCNVNLNDYTGFNLGTQCEKWRNK